MYSKMNYWSGILITIHDIYTDKVENNITRINEWSLYSLGKDKSRSVVGLLNYWP